MTAIDATAPNGEIGLDATSIAPGAAAAMADRPLCVDLDGTVLRSDSLAEGLLAIASHWDGLRRLPSFFVSSKALLKERVGELANLQVEFLPFDPDVLDFIAARRRAGQRIVLATAADEKIARRIADHLGLFDEVIASDGQSNLKGPRKAAELVRRFGQAGFDYLGDSIADLPVWQAASGSFIARPSARLVRKAEEAGLTPVAVGRHRGSLKAAVKAIRPHQWVKNLLVFVPIIASQSLLDWQGWAGTLLMFASLCATASAIYLINDLLDLAADRQHPRKRLRPFASGELAVASGIPLSALLLFVGFGLAACAGALAVTLIYAVVSISYSLALKKLPLVDVFVLAALYTLRIIAGGISSGHPVTLWLLAFSGFLFLSLAIVKRAAELVLLKSSGHDTTAARRGYATRDIPILQMFGIASAFASSVVLALFVNSTAALQQYCAPQNLWGLVPLVLFWQLRLWLSTDRGFMSDDPILYAARDWVSWLAACVGAVLIFLATSCAKS